MRMKKTFPLRGSRRRMDGISLKRCAKSCRYRYLNYLRPGIKRGDISEDEENLIIALHRQLGNRWSLIAKRLPGRSDIEIKNYWKINLSKRVHHHQHKPQENKHNDLRFSNNIIQNGDGDIYNIDQNDEIDEKVIGRHGLKGAWSRKEDQILSNYVALHGEGQWEKVSQRIGLKRSGKSCRHRYLHYLKPGIKRGNFSKDEEDMIIRLHHLHGNRWTLIAQNLAGRKDSEIKNHWHAYLSKKFTSHNNQLKPQEPKSINSTIILDDSSQVDPNLEDNNIMRWSELDNNTNTPITPNTSFSSIEFDDFLFNILQNDQIIGDDHHLDLSSNITQMEEHNYNIFASSSSSSIDNFCQLSEDVLDFWTSEFSWTDL
ncbi:Anthocyanin regulatory C1 protein [Senna tora]|uniref:Anthocyanin regulatory C1 protein n=1 Tax=Senna tora TaxID=362788 RepID=A0A834WA52_9FABA|nr:Anthocyanin regulatory C1 protein [Senna tora]